MPSDLPVAIIAAVARNGVIGREGRLPWCLPGDLAHFRRLTLGNTLVIGRRTHESIGKALPGRRTIVVSRAAIPGVEVVRALADAIAAARTAVFLAGGAGIYAEGMALADTLHITRVATTVDGDALFPTIDPTAFELAESGPVEEGPRDDYPWHRETWLRRRTRC